MMLACSVQYGVPLEKVTYQFSTADFVYMVLFGMVSLLVCLLPGHAPHTSVMALLVS